MASPQLWPVQAEAAAFPTQVGVIFDRPHWPGYREERGSSSSELLPARELHPSSHCPPSAFFTPPPPIAPPWSSGQHGELFRWWVFRVWDPPWPASLSLSLSLSSFTLTLSFFSFSLFARKTSHSFLFFLNFIAIKIQWNSASWHCSDQFLAGSVFLRQIVPAMLENRTVPSMLILSFVFCFVSRFK